METVADHALEPAVSSPPPRRLGLPLGTLALTALALLLFALFFAGGARAGWEAIKLGWIGVSGTPVPARITAVDTLPPTVLGQAAIQTSLHYTYSYAPRPGPAQETGALRLSNAAPSDTAPGGVPAATSASAPRPADAPVFHVGDALMLRRAQWLGQTLLVPWPARPGGGIVFLAFCGALIMTVSISLISRLWSWAVRRAFLLAHGVATVGTITHKHSQSEEAARCFVSYGYGDAQMPPHAFEHEEQVTPDQWKQLEIGQPVTVLYDPACPATAGLYALLRG